jgi:hypothetical protein
MPEQTTGIGDRDSGIGSQARLDQVIRELETMVSQLKSGGRPGGVTYVSKANAAEWTARLIGELKAAREACGAPVYDDDLAKPTDLLVRNLYLDDQDVARLREYLRENSKYDLNACASVLLSRGLKDWDAGRKRLAAAEAAEAAVEELAHR